MDHSHSNYFLPFDAASYFDSAAAAAAATYNPYTDFYSHPQSTPSSTSTAAAATASYHQMYRTTPTTFRHPTSFYSATMQSKCKKSLVVIRWSKYIQVYNRRIKCLAHHRMTAMHRHFWAQQRTHQVYFFMIINGNNDEFVRHLLVYNFENLKNVFNKYENYLFLKIELFFSSSRRKKLVYFKEILLIRDNFLLSSKDFILIKRISPSSCLSIHLSIESLDIEPLAS